MSKCHLAGQTAPVGQFWTCEVNNSKFAAMQPASLPETSPFQGVLFLEVERTNQWKVIL